MKYSHSFDALLRKAFPIFTLIVAFLFQLATCEAQSVVGKWKQVSGKNYFDAETVAKSHGHLKDIMDMPRVDATDDFHSDHTLIETITSEGKTTTTNSTWTQSGNTVKIAIKDQDPLIGIVSGNGKALVLSVDTPNGKKEWTYSKM
ncbi:MAG: hypothetical protein ABJC12_00880 [Saprospiraceae bacterium]